MRPPRCDFRAIRGQPAQRERDVFEDLRDCGLLIEVVVEDLAAKNQMRQMFVGLDTLDKIGGIMFDE